MTSNAKRLTKGFLQSAARHPDKLALVAHGEKLSYKELKSGADRIAATIQSHSHGEFVAVFGVGTTTVFEGILGVLLAGRAYVPLNPAFPIARTAYMLEASEVDVLVVDEVGESLLSDLLPDSMAILTIILPHAEVEKVDNFSSQFPKHRFLGSAELSKGEPTPLTDVASGQPAYLMFTSGSTGKPKGVVVSHDNVLSFISTVVGMYDLGPDDRFSQMFDLTFDLSVFDMFVCWEVGASLWVVPPKSRMAPAAFVRKSELTVWFSVPAVVGLMKQLLALKPNNFPTLRYSLFCGEPLPASAAESWQAAAPASRLDNLYGPTELTIACTFHSWDGEKSPSLCLNGIVPIGRPYDGLESAIVDANLQKVEAGADGELCLRGPQTTPGYWQRPDLTAEKFVTMPWANGSNNRWYRTGDVVRENSDGEMVFVGRVDNQVQIRGYRVELGEIEAKLRDYGMTEFAIAVPWPVGEGGAGASGLVACLAQAKVDDDTILKRCSRDLPDYMLPRWILRLEKMPLNANGKIDRNALKSLVEERDERIGNR